MPVPATTGTLCTNIADMKVGDYIVCKYVASSGAVGAFSEIGTSTATEIVVAGSATPNGTFYFVKVAKGLLVADRVVQHSITWDVLNAGKVIQGKPQTFGAGSGVIRSLTGGVAYADADGKLTVNWPSPPVGYFPLNNEWDRLIMKFPSKLIQNNKTLADVFQFKGVHSWTQDTNYLTNTNRVGRGGGPSTSTGIGGYQSASSTSNGSVGFRPVFEYQEV